ncbi:phosphotransferase [Sutcliffiella cohnii]|nr:phosphotransferase [Sutcliffiella cohnii]
MAIIKLLKEKEQKKILTVQTITKMKNKNYLMRGDLNSNRLFFYLTKVEKLQINHVDKIKENLFKVKTFDTTFILKGFKDELTVRMNVAISQHLQQERFFQCVSYYKFVNGNYYIELDNMFWAMTTYIPQRRNVSFTYKRDREAGLMLLKALHDTSKDLSLLKQIVPTERNVENWLIRLRRFEQNGALLIELFGEHTIKDIVSYSKQSLLALQQLPLPEEKQVLLHGDVASHNFLKGKDEQFYIIDFDLASIGHKEWDYVQFTNRILPSIGWDEKKFLQMPILPNLLKSNQLFRVAITFPMDILREGNKFINGQSIYAAHFLSYYAKTWQLRKKFLTNIIKVIK